jgi:DNA-binding LytR/AlgR family response regulator
MLTAPSQVVTEDITYIESQNKGLQVQTTNQQALLAELERLLVSPRHRASELNTS